MSQRSNLGLQRPNQSLSRVRPLQEQSLKRLLCQMPKIVKLAVNFAKSRPPLSGQPNEISRGQLWRNAHTPELAEYSRRRRHSQFVGKRKATFVQRMSPKVQRMSPKVAQSVNLLRCSHTSGVGGEADMPTSLKRRD
jgi:hypothetical protein